MAGCFSVHHVSKVTSASGVSTVTDWPDLDAETVKTVKRKIDTGWNIHLKDDE